ncbi:MAG: helix-turn-helix transcriptional regulator [Acidimicrobiales bacterium]
MREIVVSMATAAVAGAVSVGAVDEYTDVAAALILDARTRAGLTQAELGRRAGTAQSAIAAYESARRQPTLPTLCRILAAAGFDLRPRLAPHDPHDEALAAWEASLPADDRARWRSKLAGQRAVAAAWAGAQRR